MHLMKALFHEVIYQPLYNGLIFLMDVIPWADAGIAVILFTVLVKLVLFPLSRKAVETQLKMKQLEGDLNLLKEKYKDNKEEQARAVLGFYKEKGVNPFSGIILLFIQLPIIFALYYIFYKGGLPVVNESLLYSFVAVPTVDMSFLGLVDIAQKSVILALLAGVTQYFQIRFSMPLPPPRTDKATFQEDLARSMNFQLRYIMPIFVTFIAYSISGAIALYWTTSNVFAIGQELYLRRKLVIKEVTK